jgi:putative NIF3 family GTP cyclohydrolase 1 type 2
VGDPNTVVTGIATTFLDTMEVLREAVRRGDNLIMTHEPPSITTSMTRSTLPMICLKREVGVH